LDELQALALSHRRILIEDHNYLFNRPVRRIQELVRLGEFGSIVHVEVRIALDILGPGSRFTDPNVSHPCLSLPGGAIADFLTHLSYLAWAFIGPHTHVRSHWRKRRSDTQLPSDEFRALVVSENATAELGFSANSQPDGFWLRVHGTKMRATASLFESRLTVDQLHGGPRPLIPLRNGIREAMDVGSAAILGLVRKFSGGPGAYEGLWRLLECSYQCIERGGEPPVSSAQVREVNALVADLTSKETII
jgi:predicted dehydrogenase